MKNKSLISAAVANSSRVRWSISSDVDTPEPPPVHRLAAARGPVRTAGAPPAKAVGKDSQGEYLGRLNNLRKWFYHMLFALKNQ